MSQKRKLDQIEAEDEPLSLQDVIDEDLEMEEAAEAVLGASDDQECTYTKGYLKRQALYACYTCCSADDPLAGICLACSLECHSGHDLYELYTKRNFRCDCGNNKFPNMECKLFPNKDDSNEENKYNQNFRGLYCSCSRPYPDEEDDVEDEMIQCVLCEDWYHGRHLGETAVPSDNAFSEMICADCTKRCAFLQKYNALMIAPIKIEKEYEKDVNVIDISSDNKKENQAENDKIDQQKEVKTEASHSNSDFSCKINGAVSANVTGASFWPAGWRKVLCKCSSCLNLYKEHKVTFLLDEEDTVSAYEERGRELLQEKKRQQTNPLDGMSRMHQVEMIHGYNDMKEGLSQYLKKFADEGKVVTAADIHKFFSQLSNKRPKLGMSYHCR